MRFETGDTVAGYQILGVLGAGGMGRVFRVRNLISQREEAMKIVLPDLASEPDATERFLREIRVQASLVHPTTAARHPAITSEDSILMIMKLIDGETPHPRLQRGRVPWQEAVHYMDQVLPALGFAHGKGVVH